MKKRFLFQITLILFLLTGSVYGQTWVPPAWQGELGTPRDFLTEVAKGNIPGHTIVNKFGFGVVGSTLSPVTASGFYRTPLTAVALEFVSDDANDISNGTGAREILIDGLDANFDRFTQTIATNGTTAVPLPTSMVRLLRWSVTASGTYADQVVGSHVGQLTIQESGGGQVWSILPDIPFPASQSEIASFTVPNGVTGYVISHSIDVDTTKAANVYIFSRHGADIVTAPFSSMRMISRFIGISQTRTATFRLPTNAFPSRTDVSYMGSIATATAGISVTFQILLVEDGF